MPITPVWITDYSHGLTPSISGGGLCSSVWGTAGVNYLISSSVHRAGPYSLQLSPTASVRGCVGYTVPSSAIGVARFYIYIGTEPSSIADVFHFNTGAGDYLCLAIDPSDHKFKVNRASSLSSIYATGPGYSTGTRYQVDIKIDYTTNPSWAYVQIDGGTEFSGSFAQAGTTTTSGRVGNANTTGPAYTIYVTDLILSVTAGDYPIGPGGIAGRRPNADGTHNNAANTMEDPTGADVDGTTVFAFDKEDEDPWTTSASTDYVRQATIGTDKYCEVQFADIAETAIQGVMATLEYAAATATTDKGACIIRDSNGQETTLWGAPGATADYSENTAFFKKVIVLTPSGGWTKDHVNALRCRFGYSDDVSPNPYWLALLIEVAYSTAAAEPPTPEAEYPEVDEAYDFVYDYDGFLEMPPPENVEDFQSLAEWPEVDESYDVEHDYAGLAAWLTPDDVVESVAPPETPTIDETYDLEHDYSGLAEWLTPEDIQDFQPLAEWPEVDESFDLDHDYAGWPFWVTPGDVVEPYIQPEATQVDESYDSEHDYAGLVAWQTPEDVQDFQALAEWPEVDESYDQEHDYAGWPFWATPEDIVEPLPFVETAQVDEAYEQPYEIVDFFGWQAWVAPESLEAPQPPSEWPAVDESYEPEYDYAGWQVYQAPIDVIAAGLVDWTVRARSADWALAERGLAWALDARRLEWQLAGRGLDWSLEERSTAWTLGKEHHG